MHPDFESVDIGGRNLRYRCGGEGELTVVFEQGQGVSVEEDFSNRIVFGWPRVFLAVREIARALLYDRAGLGWSDEVPGPRTSRDVVHDLRAMLRNLALAPPYILVGHSIGGFTVRQFASEYPQEVAGLVLVDSAHPDQQTLLSHLLPQPPPLPRREILPFHCLRAKPQRSIPGGVDFEASAALIRAAPSLGDKPVIVVSRDFKPIVGLLAEGLEPEKAQTIERVWAQLQDDLLRVSTNSSRTVAAGSGHDVARDAPQVVIDAITRMLTIAGGAGSTSPNQ